MSDKIEKIIDALRKKILDAAIRGQLVPQNPDDEPASALVERIAYERECLIKEKKIKKPKSASRIFRRDGHFYESTNGGKPVCIDDDIPFEIPDSWEWVRLESICEVNPRNKLHEELLAGFIPMASVREGFSNYHDVNTKKWGDIKSGYTHLRNNDVMVAKITPCFQNRKSAIVANLPNGYGAGSTEFHIARTFDEKIIPSFLLVLFKSEYFIQKGLATFTGTAGQQRISSDFFSSFLVALPPTNEQFRLVFAVQSRLQALNDIEKSRIRYKYILSETPTSLRQQLIQAAIQGQLVPQNPSDEPASILLERIAKERIAKLGKKAAKSISRIERRGRGTYEIFPDGSEKDISGEIPFDIPDSWEWCRMNNCLDVRDGTHDTPAYVTQGIPLITSKNLKNGSIDFSSAKMISLRDHQSISERSHVDSGDIMFAMIGSIGNPVLYKGNDVFSIKNMALFKQIENGINMEYVLMWLTFQQSDMRKQAAGGVQSFVSLNYLRNYLIPVPPLNEQHRIIEKLGVLMNELGATK